MTTERNAQGVDADALFAAVKRSGMRSPVFLDGYRVSFPESEVMRLAERLTELRDLSARWRREMTTAANLIHADELDAALSNIEGASHG